MRILLLNFLLALSWTGMTGVLTSSNLLVGFLVGYGVLFLVRPILGPTKYFGRFKRTVYFAAHFFKDLVVSSLRVAYDILTPRDLMQPGVISFEMEAATDLEITFLANVISLTPGTLTLDVSPCRKKLYIHAMYLEDDGESLRGELRQLERRVLKVIR